MEGGSRLDRENKDVRRKGEKLGSVLDPKIEPFVPRKGYDPNELRSWAKRTGFVSTFSGETERSVSGRRELNEGRNNGGGGGYADLEKGVSERNESISPKIEIDPILGRTRKRKTEIEPARGVGNARERDGVLVFKDGVDRGDNEVRRNGTTEANSGTNNALRTDGNDGSESVSTVGNGHGAGANAPAMEPKSSDDVNMYVDGEDLGDGGWHPSPKMIVGLKDNPGYG